jgi:hypothetical protein
MGWFRGGWYDDIQTILKKYDVVVVTQSAVQRRALVVTVMNLRDLQEAGSFLIG